MDSLVGRSGRVAGWLASRFGCFQKLWYPQIIHFNTVFHYKPSILGYPYFWKHPDLFLILLMVQKIGQPVEGKVVCPIILQGFWHHPSGGCLGFFSIHSIDGDLRSI